MVSERFSQFLVMSARATHGSFSDLPCGGFGVHADEVHSLGYSRLKDHRILGSFFTAGDMDLLEIDQAERRNRNDSFPGQRGIDEDGRQDHGSQDFSDVSRGCRDFIRMFQFPVFSQQNVRRSLRSHNR